MRKTVAILQPDRARADALATKLKSLFRLVLTARSLQELRELASRFDINFGIVDLASVSFSDICPLRLELGMEIVCTHRLADETMWMQALEVGALDCCLDDDIESLIRAIDCAAKNRAAAA